MLKCSMCGVESGLKQGFVKARSGLGAAKTVCLACKEYSYHNKSILGRIILQFLYWVIIAYLIAANLSLKSNGWLLINIGMVLVLMYPAIVIHEFGHYVLAKAVGYQPVIIKFGRGKSFYERVIGETCISFHVVPAGGLTLSSPATKSFGRVRLMLFALGGPLMNLVAAEIIRHIVLGAPGSFTLSPEPLMAFMVTNYFMGTVNLIPFKSAGSTEVQWSDGGKLITIPFYDKAKLNELDKSYYYGKYHVAYKTENYEGCLNAATKGLEKYPDDTLMKQLLGTAYLAMHEYDKADDILGRLLRDESISEMTKASLYNELAWLIYLQNDTGRVSEADRYSSEAMALMPWSLAVRSTRGSVLNMLGRYTEAVKLLDDKRFVVESAANRARVLCSLAVSYENINNIDAANNAIKRAKELDSDCELLERAEN